MKLAYLIEIQASHTIGPAAAGSARMEAEQIREAIQSPLVEAASRFWQTNLTNPRVSVRAATPDHSAPYTQP